ncbi:MAG: prolipoprotein diacylglyceryl transferase [Candidatus Sumerlaeia bacterium]
MHPILFQIGNFPVGTYGLMIVVGIMAAIGLASFLARRRGMQPEFFQDLAMVALLAGFVGGRLLYVLLDVKYYLNNPGEIVFSRGGFVFQGGAILAILVCIWYIRRHRQPMFETADIAAPALVLAHAFGRIGCFLAGCCYGLTCTADHAHPVLEKIAVQYPLVKDAAGNPVEMFNWAYSEQVRNGLIEPGAAAPLPIVPVQLFESAGNFLICAVLVWAWRRKRFSGQIAAMYLGLYGLLRFSLEFLRGDTERGLWLGGSISTAQIISIGMIAAAAALWAARMNQGLEPIPAPAQEKPEKKEAAPAGGKRKHKHSR